MNKRITIKLTLVFSVILFSNLVCSEMLVSEAGVQYDSKIVSKFNNGTEFVKAAIVLKDTSGISVEKGSNNTDAQRETKNNFLENKSREMINSFPEGEFNLTILSRNIFEGYVSKKLFYKLLNNSDIESIVDHTEAPEKLVPLENLENGASEEEIAIDENKLSEEKTENKDISFTKKIYFGIAVILFLIISFSIIKIKLTNLRKTQKL